LVVSVAASKLKNAQLPSRYFAVPFT
jgi:hypothetical protein